MKELRKEKNISQEELGTICGVAKQTVSNWENNVTQPPFDSVKIIAEYFNVSTDYLFDLNQDDLDNIERLKIALKEAGIMAGDDLTIEEFEKALQIVEMLKERKD